MLTLSHLHFTGVTMIKVLFIKKSGEKILGTPIGATFGCQHERVKEKSRFGNYKLEKKVNTLSKTEPPPPHPKTWHSFFLFNQCGVASYNLTLQKTISPADLQLFGLSQTYLQAFQPAALAITYGHFLNAKPEACGQPAGSSPFSCVLGDPQMVAQTNVIGIQVLY